MIDQFKTFDHFKMGKPGVGLIDFCLYFFPDPWITNKVAVIAGFDPVIITPCFQVHEEGTISAEGNLWPSPITMACSIKEDSFSLFSINWGAMNFPPEVLKISSFLSVIFRKRPSTISPISPVWSHPST